ncbi:MAG: hypothetical protein WCA89_13185, partial [Terracidiphilus sp.]
KPAFSGDFQRPNLTMRENLGAEIFPQALIPNELEIICKVLGKIYTPLGYKFPLKPCRLFLTRLKSMPVEKFPPPNSPAS